MSSYVLIIAKSAKLSNVIALTYRKISIYNVRMNMTIVLKALANEKRLKILEWLKEPARHFKSLHCDVVKDGVCVGLIEEKSGLSQSTVSQYLLLLQQAGLITTERRGQWTFCKRNEKGWKQFIKLLEAL
jgi:DNA-binding transcriptional ArsR family regulator